jgi:DNA-binding response OmpR family regulator
MIIDGSRLNRVIVDVCLRRQDTSSIGFSNGASALQALQEDPEWIPRVIVLELAFPAPGIDGYALIRLLRVSSRLDRTAILVLTSKRGLVSRARARLAGANEYLTKPFVQKHFLLVILPYLRPRQEHIRPFDQDQGALLRRASGEEYHESVLHPGPAERDRCVS